MSDDAPNEHFLSCLRDQVKAFTEADPYFLPIPILNERLKDLSAKIDQQIGVLGGIMVLLVTPAVGGVLANVKGANFSNIVFVARVLENVNINETGKEALDVAVYIAALWSQARPDTFSSALVPTDNVITLGNDPKYLSYDVAFTTEGGTKIDIPRLAAPTIDASNSAAVGITSATPGAAIFYTLDGTPPIPRNPSSHLFLAPFAALSGQTIRARAWLAGFIPSVESKIKITL